MQEVLEELRVHVERYNLYDGKTNITTLPQTLKEADGIILATTVEWYGIGGYMQHFLDACWLYGDKEAISGIYMCPVVMSTTYGEREGKLNLATAWEILGGLPCSGICGYIENTVSLEMNEQYVQIIEKKAENMYRTINQRLASFPASNKVMRQKITIPKSINLTPQETEQLSEYVSDDSYVQRQKEDIQELLDQGRFAVIPVDMCGAIAMKRSFPTHIIYVARDKEKLIADIIDSDYDTEEKTLRILSIDAEKRNRKICDHVIHNDIIEGNYVSGAEKLRRLIATAEGKNAGADPVQDAYLSTGK